MPAHIVLEYCPEGHTVQSANTLSIVAFPAVAMYFPAAGEVRSAHTESDVLPQSVCAHLPASHAEHLLHEHESELESFKKKVALQPSSLMPQALPPLDDELSPSLDDELSSSLDDELSSSPDAELPSPLSSPRLTRSADVSQLQVDSTNVKPSRQPPLCTPQSTGTSTSERERPALDSSDRSSTCGAVRAL